MFELNIGNGSLPASTTSLLNSNLKSSTLDKIDAIKTLANDLVENEGYISITRQTEIISAKGLRQSISYKTYITYLSEVRNGLNVGLFKSDGTEMLHFSDSINDDRLHENFFGQDEPAKKISYLLAQHYILEKHDSLSPDEIEELEKFRDEQLSQDKNIHKR